VAAVAAVEGCFGGAARVGGAAEALRIRLGLPLTADQQGSHDQMVRLARAGLGEDVFAQAWAVGVARPVEETITAVPQLTNRA
jgi:hypothetical protein